jgi:hypothetical protein
MVRMKQYVVDFGFDLEWRMNQNNDQNRKNNDCEE